MTAPEVQYPKPKQRRTTWKQWKKHFGCINMALQNTKNLYFSGISNFLYYFKKR